MGGRTSRQRGGRVLVVDDDPDLCTNLSDILGQKNYRVKVARDGEAAIEMAGKNKFDIILLDLKLPTLNSLETYLAIRDIRPDVVVILITGYPKEMADITMEILEKNACICLEKPFNMDNLLKLLEEVLE
jgi:DNA-binding response OmpR family regulator